MSLVDYASSDEDETEVAEEHRNPFDNPTGKASSIPDDNPQSQQPVLANQRSLKSSKQQSDSSLHHPEPSFPQLPDASLLLDSPVMPSNLGGYYDHSSRVAATMAQNVLRKRESKESTSTFPRGKVPRGSLPHPKGIPDTVGGLLRPPQLSGRQKRKVGFAAMVSRMYAGLPSQ